MDEQQRSINRRRFVECFSAAGLGSALMPGALAAVAQDAATITIDMLQSAHEDRRRCRSPPMNSNACSRS